MNFQVLQLGLFATFALTNFPLDDFVRVKNRIPFVTGLFVLILFCLAYMGGRPLIVKYKGAILAVCLALAFFFFLDAFLDSPRHDNKDSDS